MTPPARLATLARALTAAAALFLGRAAVSHAQAAVTPAQGPTPAPAVAPAGPAVALPASVRAQIRSLRESRELGELPPDEAFVVGGRTIPAGTTVRGPAYVASGPLVVEGTLEGGALAVQGDVVVRPGGAITGDAIAVGGRVRIEGGEVGGELRSLDRPATPAAKLAGAEPQRSPAEATGRSVKLALAWLAILVIVGFGVLTFSEPTLNGMVEALEEKFGRSFTYGLLAQLAAIPALLLLVIALAISVIGLLLIPFALVAYIVGFAGLAVLGFLAVARFTGGAIWREPAGARATPRGASVRALVTGLALYLGLWVVAAAFTWSPLVGVLMRTIALSATWVAVTLGLGAVVQSRVILRNARRDARELARAGDALAWQTPTPITGVAAARRRPHVSRQDAVR